ncbi:N-acetylmuramoyl-L-alanine amidase [Azospirillum oleiclasticum]|nr:N-acetylmuramoyl-L-alanine amidase [Azospirillum oleiclasticum]
MLARIAALLVVLVGAAFGPAFGSGASGAALAASSGRGAEVAQATAALPAPISSVAVLDARLGVHADKTRFVLELSQEVPFRVTALADPYRVVVDLPELAWPGGAVPVPGKGLVVSYRYGLFEPGNLRIVFDTSGPVRVRESFMLPAQDGRQPRLVLDLEPVDRRAFDRAYAAAVLAPGGAGAAGVATPLPARPPVLPVAAAMVVPIPPPLPPRPVPVPEKPVVAIDPGHGGVDPGAVGVGDVYEKTITLATARELRRHLEATGRYRVVMTRDKDVFVPLRDRVAIARDAGADLFISLHADSIGSTAIRGLSVYTLSDQASDREAEMLAAKENRADAIAGMNLASENDQVASILINLAQRDTMNHSKRFANTVLEHLRREVKLLPAKPHRQAGFAVLTAPDVPSVLVEMGYLSSPADANLLTSQAHREKLARSLTRGIDAYFTWLAKVSRS